MKRHAHQPVLLGRLIVAQRQCDANRTISGLTRMTRNAVRSGSTAIVGSPGHLPRITQIADDHAAVKVSEPTVDYADSAPGHRSRRERRGSAMSPLAIAREVCVDASRVRRAVS